MPLGYDPLVACPRHLRACSLFDGNLVMTWVAELPVPLHFWKASIQDFRTIFYFPDERNPCNIVFFYPSGVIFLIFILLLYCLFCFLPIHRGHSILCELFDIQSLLQSFPRHVKLKAHPDFFYSMLFHKLPLSILAIVTA